MSFPAERGHGIDRPFDIVYESATTRTAFDGDWKAQKLSKEAYQENFTRADKRYTHALEVLVGALTAKAEPTEAEK